MENKDFLLSSHCKCLALLHPTITLLTFLNYNVFKIKRYLFLLLRSIFLIVNSNVFYESSYSKSCCMYLHIEFEMSRVNDIQITKITATISLYCYYLHIMFCL